MSLLPSSPIVQLGPSDWKDVIKALDQMSINVSDREKLRYIWLRNAIMAQTSARRW